MTSSSCCSTADEGVVLLHVNKKRSEYIANHSHFFVLAKTCCHYWLCLIGSFLSCPIPLLRFGRYVFLILSCMLLCRQEQSSFYGFHCICAFCWSWKLNYNYFFFRKNIWKVSLLSPWIQCSIERSPVGLQIHRQVCSCAWKIPPKSWYTSRSIKQITGYARLYGFIFSVWKSKCPTMSGREDRLHTKERAYQKCEAHSHSPCHQRTGGQKNSQAKIILFFNMAATN